MTGKTSPPPPLFPVRGNANGVPFSKVRNFRSSAENRAATKEGTARQGGTFSYLLFLLALTSGLRLNELLALTWKNWDPITKTITVEHSLGPNGTFGPPKTKSSRRRLRLPSETASVLESYRQQLQQQGRPVDNETFIFLLPQGKVVPNPSLQE
jgi:integrase